MNQFITQLDIFRSTLDAVNFEHVKFNQLSVKIDCVKMNNDNIVCVSELC